MPSPPLDHTHPEILPLDDFPAIFSSLISLLCLRSHLSSLKCRIFYCWGFALSMTFHFASNSPCKLIHNHKTQPAPLRRCLQVRCTVQQQSPSFSQQGPVSWKTTFPQMWWWEGWFGDYSSTLHVLCTLSLLLLHQLHLGPSGIRSQRLRTTAIEDRVHSGERHA